VDGYTNGYSWCNDTDLNREFLSPDHLEIIRLTRTLTRRDAALRERSEQLRELETSMQELLHSRSWRITRPLRAVVYGLRSLKDMVQDGHVANRSDGQIDSERKLGLAIKPLMGDFVSWLQNIIRSNKKPSYRIRPVEDKPIERTRSICVLMPVYGDTALTKDCIESAMAGIMECPEAFLLIVNDASPEPHMESMLQRCVEKWPGHVDIVMNQHNVGFVTSVNTGMMRHTTHDMVLLNSDVILPQGWLRRLADEAYSGSRIATVTPLSNNTTICTFPEFLQDNSFFDLDVAAMDAVFNGYPLDNVETPTGVGFCMYIRRDCLDEVGYFDAKRFGRGYGEENDFCQRAIKLGWSNLITPNLYVFHRGGVSFGVEKEGRVKKALGIMDALHPNYHRDIARFVEDDPLREARIFRLMDLLASLPLPKILFVSHGLGGGADQYIDELADYLFSTQQAFPLILIPDAGSDRCRLRFGYRETADEIILQLPEEFEFLVQILRKIKTTRVHFNHAMNVHDILLQLPQVLAVGYYLTIHDYYFLTANPTLTDARGVYSESLQWSTASLPEGMTRDSWHKKYKMFVEGADMVVFPSAALRRFFGNIFHFKCEVTAGHLEILRDVSKLPNKFIIKKHFTIGVLGALSLEKGAEYLEELALESYRSGLPITFTLIGYPFRPLSKVTVTGPYRHQDLSNLIDEHGCDILLFPARWPETYSYTLSSALESGLPIVAPDLGAFPERLANRDHVMLFEHGIAAKKLLDQLMRFITSLRNGDDCKAPLCSVGECDACFYEREYLHGLHVEATGSCDDERAVTWERLCSHRKPRTGNFRKILLELVWAAYSKPGMRRMSELFPYRFRRYIKQTLSRRPIHDSLNK
jgi:GT2 family glycosyltransferase/glycosyltransferase involved in cell wall biosynthesis